MNISAILTTVENFESCFYRITGSRENLLQNQTSLFEIPASLISILGLLPKYVRKKIVNSVNRKVRIFEPGIIA